MKQLALSGLETAFNAYLRLDPETIRRLATLKGKIIKINLTDWHTEFYIAPLTHGVQLLATCATTPDTTISGRLIGLMKAGYTGASGRSLFQHNISIQGNTDVGETIRDILAHIDIDWEEHLAAITGDVIAHDAATTYQRARRFGQQVTQKLTNDLADYLMYEAALLPSPKEIENFIQDVIVIRDDVERLEARYQRLLLKKSNSHD